MKTEPIMPIPKTLRQKNTPLEVLPIYVLSRGLTLLMRQLHDSQQHCPIGLREFHNLIP